MGRIKRNKNRLIGGGIPIKKGHRKLTPVTAKKRVKRKRIAPLPEAKDETT